MITLFSSILQNPQDSTARTDIHLIGLVIKFLSSLNAEHDDNFKQMLSLCTEFQKMANLVLEKSEQDLSLAKKCKEGDIANGPQTPMAPATNSRPSVDPQPSGVLSSTTKNQIHGWHDHTDTASSNGLPDGNSWNADMGTGEVLQGHAMPLEHGMPFFDDLDQLHNRLSIGNLTNVANLNPLQQAFIPQDLMNMPMELDWDWSDTFGSGYTAFGNNGQFGNDAMNP